MEKPLSKENELSKSCPFMSSTIINSEGEVELLAADCMGQSCVMWYDFNKEYGKCLASASAEGQMLTYLNNYAKGKQNAS